MSLALCAGTDLCGVVRVMYMSCREVRTYSCTGLYMGGDPPFVLYQGLIGALHTFLPHVFADYRKGAGADYRIFNICAHISHVLVVRASRKEYNKRVEDARTAK